MTTTTADAFTASYNRTLDAQATYAMAFKVACLAAGSGSINAETLAYLIEINGPTIVHGERTVRLAAGRARVHAKHRLDRALGITAQLRVEINLLAEAAE